MSGFFDNFMQEAIARRVRIASTIGPKMQGIFDVMIIGAVTLGSAGLFAQPWMLAAAPYGLALPVVFLVGHVLLDTRRQKTPINHLHKDEQEEARNRTDLYAVGWGVACAALGALIFFYAWGQEPPPPPAPAAEQWEPPPNVLESEIAR
jgi:hypothetical protein